jgi:hypothetical protein
LSGRRFRVLAALLGNVKQEESRIPAYAFNLDLGTPINACISFGEM